MSTTNLQPARSVEEILAEKGHLVIPANTAEVSQELQELVAAGKIVLQEAGSRGCIAQVRVVLAT